MKDTRRLPETQANSPVHRPDVPNVLQVIVRSKEREIEALRSRAAELRTLAGDAPPVRDFRAALARPESVSLIAEVKRRSPGAGAIRPGLDPAKLAREYEAGGASALSVLTDGPYFGGSLADLSTIREAVQIPLLRKDFTLDPLHIWEARGAGADAVLLIVRILDDARLRDLRMLAEELGMEALVEAHGEGEVERALVSGARILGVNNRDLATFTTRLERTLELVPRVAPDVVFVSESGIRSREDVARLGEAGVDAILVGEALLLDDEPGNKARELAGIPRAPRG
jgi:indole-3-glycerol phosphate synthase